MCTRPVSSAVCSSPAPFPRCSVPSSAAALHPNPLSHSLPPGELPKLLGLSDCFKADGAWIPTSSPDLTSEPQTHISSPPWVAPPAPSKLNIPHQICASWHNYPLECQARTGILSSPLPHVQQDDLGPLSLHPPTPFRPPLLVCILPAHPQHLWLGLQPRSPYPFLLPPSQPCACPIRHMPAFRRLAVTPNIPSRARAYQRL